MLMGAAVDTGATCVLMERFDPVECLELVERHRVTLVLRRAAGAAGL